MENTPTPVSGRPFRRIIKDVQEPQATTPTVTIVQIVKEDSAKELSMIDVSVAAFGLTGVIMGAAIVAGLVAGAAFI